MMKIHGVCIVLVSLISVFAIANCVLPQVNTPLGGVFDDNGNPNTGGDVATIGRFAIDEQNKKANTHMEFVRVESAKQQVVSGKIYKLVVEAKDGGQTHQYAVKVLVKPWMNFKQLQSFAALSPNA